MSIQTSPKTVTDSLVLYLDAANSRSFPGSGSNWLDISKTRNDCALSGPVNFNPSNLGTFTFNGSNTYVNAGMSMNSFIATNLPVSFEVFCYLNINGGDQVIIGNTWTSRGMNLRLTSANTIRYTNSQNAGSYRSMSTPAITTGWYHIVATFNGTNINDNNSVSIYLNSVFSNASPLSSGSIADMSATNPLNFGRSADVANYAYLTGNIALVKMYSKALSSDEITQNYNALKKRFGL